MNYNNYSAYNDLHVTFVTCMQLLNGRYNWIIWIGWNGNVWTVDKQWKSGGKVEEDGEGLWLYHNKELYFRPCQLL